MLNTIEFQSEFDELDKKWLNYQEIYNEYVEQTADTNELEQIGTRKRELDRKINDYRSAIIGLLRKSVNEHKHLEIDDVKSILSLSSSTSSKRSSKACAAVRTEQLAKLKLEQAMKRAQLKQKQLQAQGTDRESPSRNGD